MYFLAILFVLFHSLFDAHLIYHYLRSQGKKNRAVYEEENTPFVTIQLPVYNEMFVVERLLDAVTAIDYPADKLEIQILDDSTDETSELIARTVALLQKKNITVRHIQRQNREGFKAGALKNGLSMAKGEYIAIFDSDFLPSKDFLKRTMPFFADSSIGMVQTKWGHINKNASLLTSLQAIALDGHFSIEQTGRNTGGYFINFNGTGGVWRKQCILDAGNWQADTLTEDLDLSYRAQLKGWKFLYLEDVTTPAELPPVISAFKSQQFRWAKGGAETAKKNLRKVLKSNLPFLVKWHGFFHLVYSFGFVSIITSLILSLPIIIIKEHYGQYNSFFNATSVIGFCFLIYILHYFISYVKSTNGSLVEKIGGFIIRFPLFVALFMGVSLNNAIGIMQGYLGFKSGFVRTPKFNTTGSNTFSKQNKYTENKLSVITIIEGALVLYFIWGIMIAFQFKSYVTVLLFMLAATGFSIVFVLSLKEKLIMKKAR